MHISARVFKWVFLTAVVFSSLLVLAIRDKITTRNNSLSIVPPTFDADPIIISRCLGKDSCLPPPIDIMTSRTTDIKTAAVIPDSTCTTPLAGVAYIKTHKTGSTTLGHIMNRFGYQRNMSFVLDPERATGHFRYINTTKDSPKNRFLNPLNVKTGDYKNYKYDMLTVHVRYNREAMDTFMKPDTRYITIIRDPGTQFESAFVHLQFDDAIPGNKTDRTSLNTITAKIEEWFRHPDEYSEKLKALSWHGVKGLRFFYARNNQIFDLGLDVDKHGNETRVDGYIERLTKELDMVIITEYIEESLLVMKKRFCWSLEDILFIPKNERSALVKNYTITESLRDKMREWNAIDYKLYQRFHDTLWRKIDSYGEEFYEELKQYRRLLNETFHNCTQGSYFKNKRRMFQNINYKPAPGSGELCQLIAEDTGAILKRVKARQLARDLSHRSIQKRRRKAPRGS